MTKKLTGPQYEALKLLMSGQHLMSGTCHAATYWWLKRNKLIEDHYTITDAGRAAFVTDHIVAMRSPMQTYPTPPAPRSGGT